jgi:hypothetical protein
MALDTQTLWKKGLLCQANLECGYANTFPIDLWKYIFETFVGEWEMWKLSALCKAIRGYYQSWSMKPLYDSYRVVRKLKIRKQIDERKDRVCYTPQSRWIMHLKCTQEQRRNFAYWQGFYGRTTCLTWASPHSGANATIPKPFYYMGMVEAGRYQLFRKTLESWGLKARDASAFASTVKLLCTKAPSNAEAFEALHALTHSDQNKAYHVWQTDLTLEVAVHLLHQFYNVRPRDAEHRKNVPLWLYVNPHLIEPLIERDALLRAERISRGLDPEDQFSDQDEHPFPLKLTGKIPTSKDPTETKLIRSAVQLLLKHDRLNIGSLFLSDNRFTFESKDLLKLIWTHCTQDLELFTRIITKTKPDVAKFLYKTKFMEQVSIFKVIKDTKLRSVSIASYMVQHYGTRLSPLQKGYLIREDEGRSDPFLSELFVEHNVITREELDSI